MQISFCDAMCDAGRLAAAAVWESGESCRATYLELFRVGLPQGLAHTEEVRRFRERAAADLAKMGFEAAADGTPRPLTSAPAKAKAAVAEANAAADKRSSEGAEGENGRDDSAGDDEGDETTKIFAGCHTLSTLKSAHNFGQYPCTG